MITCGVCEPQTGVTFDKIRCNKMNENAVKIKRIPKTFILPQKKPISI